MRLIARYLLCPALWLVPAMATAQSYLPLFDTAMDAQQHCPYDMVDQIRTQDVMPRYKGQPKHTGQEGYVCRQEAVNAGYGGKLIHLQPMQNQPGQKPSTQKP